MSDKIWDKITEFLKNNKKLNLLSPLSNFQTFEIIEISDDYIKITIIKRTNFHYSSSGWAEENTGRNSDIIDFKRNPVMPDGSSNLQSGPPDWALLELKDFFISTKTIIHNLMNY